MTGAQADWLKKHRNVGYEAIGNGRKYVQRGILHADGTFEVIVLGQRRRITEGCFEVGKRENQ